MTAGSRRALWMLLLVACLLRLGAVLWRAHAPLDSDEILYDELARSLVQSHALLLQEQPPVPTAVVMPGYPLFVAAIYALTGYSALAVRLAQALVGVLTCLLVWRIGSAIGGARVGLIAGWLFAGHPVYVLATTQLMMDTVFVGLVAATVLCGMHMSQSPSRRWAMLTGGCCALATLCRPEMALWPLAWLAAVWLQPVLRARLWRHAAWCCLTAALVMAPWMVRNAVVFDRFIPLTRAGGVHFWEGMTGRWFIYDFVPTGRSAPLNGVVEFSEMEAWDAEAYRQGWQALRAAPGAVLSRMVSRTALLYSVPHATLGSSAPWRRLLLYLLQWALVALGLLGARRLWRDPPARVLLATVAYFTLLYSLMPAVPRYNMAIMLLVIPVAALVLAGRRATAPVTA